ncbi:MAG: Rnf-Nqr domain containing protein, partial [Mariprofundaceae bacterium]|nr:Rnf-Nqr domain containing protein [Mariprofundaceae bacterium]
MSEFALIMLSAVLVNNFVLTKFLGICPFLGVSSKVETAVGMSLAVLFVMTLASTASWLVQQFILIPFDLMYLQTIFFILIIAVLVQFIEMLIHKSSPVLYQALGIFLPLITTNCAVLGVALLNVQQEQTFMTSALYGF